MSPAEGEPPPLGFWTKLLLWGLGGIFLLALAGWIALDRWDQRTRARFEARLAAMRAAGLPTEIEEIVPPLEVSDGEGSRLLRQASDLLTAYPMDPQASDMFCMKPTGPWSEEEKALVERHLAACGPALDLASRAARSPPLVLDRDWGSLSQAASPRSSGLSNLQRLLLARAALRAGTASQAEDLSTLLRLGMGIRTFFAFDLLLKQACIGSACRAILEEASVPSGEIETLRASIEPPLSALDWRTPRQEALRGERVMSVGMVRSILEDGLDPDLIPLFLPDLPPFAWSRLKPYLIRDAPLLLDILDEMDRMAKDPLPKAVPALRAFRDRNKRLEEFPPSVLSGLMTPMWIRAALHAHQSEGTACLVRVGLAAAVHRRRTGANPVSPEDLSPLFPGGVPPDPFTGKPFRFEPQADGSLRISSAGPDGKPGWTKEKEEERLAWTLSPPSPPDPRE